MSDGPNTGDTLITTLAVSHGTITVGATSGVTIPSGRNGTGTVTLTGTAAAIDAALTTSTNANYTGNLNYYGPDSLSVQTTDTNNSATSGTKTGGHHAGRYDDGVGGGACLEAERQREHGDLAERDFGVGWS